MQISAILDSNKCRWYQIELKSDMNGLPKTMPFSHIWVNAQTLLLI